MKQRSRPGTPLINLEHLHHLIAQVVDHFHRDPAALWFVERPAGVAVERFPGFGMGRDSTRLPYPLTPPTVYRNRRIQAKQNPKQFASVPA